MSVDLPAPFSPHSGVDLAGEDIERDVGERGDVAEPLGDACGREEGRHRRSGSRPGSRSRIGSVHVAASSESRRG